MRRAESWSGCCCEAPSLLLDYGLKQITTKAPCWSFHIKNPLVLLNVSALCSVWVWEPEAGGPESQWNDFREHAAVVIPLKRRAWCEWMTSVCFQIILCWCQPSSLHTLHPSLLFVPFFCDLQLPLLFISPSSLSIAPRLFLSLPLFLRLCIWLFFLAGEQVVLIPVTLHIFPSVSLWESILGSAVYRRCSLEALC